MFTNDQLVRCAQHAFQAIRSSGIHVAGMLLGLALILPSPASFAVPIRIEQYWDSVNSAGPDVWTIRSVAFVDDSLFTGVGVEQGFISYLGISQIKNGVGQTFTTAVLPTTPSYTDDRSIFAQFTNGTTFDYLHHVDTGGGARTALQDSAGVLTGQDVTVRGFGNQWAPELIIWQSGGTGTGFDRYQLNRTAVTLPNPPPTVPEPGVFTLFATGLLLLWLVNRRRRPERPVHSQPKYNHHLHKRLDTACAC